MWAIRVTPNGDRFKAEKNWAFQDEDLFTNGTYSSVATGRSVVFSLCEWSSNLLALDRKTGTLLWKFGVDDTTVSHGFPSPIIHGDRLYVPAADNLYIVRVARERGVIGKIKFDSFVQGAPVIDGNKLFIATRRGRQSLVKALDLSSIDK